MVKESQVFDQSYLSDNSSSGGSHDNRFTSLDANAEPGFLPFPDNNAIENDGNKNVTFFSDSASQYVDTTEVFKRIERVAYSILMDLEQDGKLPKLEVFHSTHENNCHYDDDNDADQTTHIGNFHEKTTVKAMKEFNLQQSRSMTSIVMILSYCHNLLLQGKTTTIRELYYFYVTHFRNQRECDLAIRDAAVLLNIPRHALGLKASPKGWYCGDLQIITRRDNGANEDEVVTDARALPSLHGAPIDSTWVHLCNEDAVRIQRRRSGGEMDYSMEYSYEDHGERTVVSTQAARCILVVEKEGIYNRLAEDRFYDTYPCIIMTAKGFPDLASRAMLHFLYTHLKLPVWGLCDCNPFGILVMHTYFRGSAGRGTADGGSRFAVPIQWMGLRPSQVEELKQETAESGIQQGVSPLPPQVFQELTSLDRKRLEDTLMGSFGVEWTSCSERRWEELELMKENGYKVELEALHWMGMDFFNEWLGKIFDHEFAKNQCQEQESDQLHEECSESFLDII